MITGIILLLIILFIIIFLISRIKIVPQAQEYVFERLGSYSTTWTTGFICWCRLWTALRKRCP